MNNSLEREVDRLHAEICAGLSDPTRILIIYQLADEPHTVTQLTQALKLSQPLVSRHLKTLRERKMVIATRTGLSVEYKLADHRLIEALDILRAVLRDSLSRSAELVDVFDEE